MINNLLKVHVNKLVMFIVWALSCTIVSAQNISVTGKVTGANGAVIAGASVKVKDSQAGTTTDSDGNFKIDVPARSVLVFSYVGFQEKQVQVNGSNNFTVSLTEAKNDLNEVVVIGYGSRKKRDITAAVANINVNDIGEQPSRNPSILLQGQASGVVAYQRDGTPGAEFEVRIRGISSLGAGSAPLYVVDGFPIGTSIGTNFNPNDIESISILKDASATAIYGARGSNGVVLITTKNAKEGQLSTSLSVDYGIQNVPDSRKVKVLNGVEFAQFKKEVWMDNVRYFQNREPSIDEVPEGFRYPEQTKYSTNWFDEILHNNAPYTDINLTFSSGKGPVSSLLSIGYYNEQGAIIKTNYERYSVRSNLKAKINNIVTVGWNIAGSYKKYRGAATDGRDAIIGASLIIDPREPVYDADGKMRPYIGGKDGVFGYPNPVFELINVVRTRDAADLVTNGYAEFSILKGLKFRSSVNARINFTVNKDFKPSTIGDRLGSGSAGAPPKTASLDESRPQLINTSADQLLTYAPNMGKDHSLDFLVGFTAQQEKATNLIGTGNTFPNDLVPYLDAAVIRSSRSSGDDRGVEQWSLLAYIARANYAYKDKYLLSASFRREGSSRFGENNKYGNFPAASVGWRMTNEEFMPEISWLNDLKLRASWGVTGNNNIGNYSSLSFLNTNNYILSNSVASGVTISSFANTSLKWEKSDQLNVGIDLALLKNKIVITAEYYKKITNDMLLPISIPAVSGFTSSLSNIGKVQNKGFEFAIDYSERIGKFNLRNSFNITFNRNEILAINGPNDMLWYGAFYNGYSVQKVGRPVGMIYGYKKLGIFNTQEEIDKAPKQDGVIPGGMKFWDADGNGEVTYDTKDMVEIGNPNPKFTWGYTIAADYRGFDINVLFIGAQGFDVYRQIEESTMNMDGVFNVLDKAKDRWRSPQNPGSNPNDVHSQGGTNYFKWSRESSNRYIYRAGYIWLKNVSIGYNLPGIKYLGNVRVYVSGYNLFLFTKYPGNNPDVSQRSSVEDGNDDEAYPVPRTFAGGVKINF